jgi:hypothetical protein
VEFQNLCGVCVSNGRNILCESQGICEFIPCDEPDAKCVCLQYRTIVPTPTELELNKVDLKDIW